ncbi:hypothetical protein GCM10025751_47710 [Haladaptatus pallidirubidus]|uniref:Transposase n=1 Tax=Haladaptatus pallidirubidus TaxID=1008152 RepID=A0AAV3UP45_9EURY
MAPTRLDNITALRGSRQARESFDRLSRLLAVDYDSTASRLGDQAKEAKATVAMREWLVLLSFESGFRLRMNVVGFHHWQFGHSTVNPGYISSFSYFRSRHYLRYEVYH